MSDEMNAEALATSETEEVKQTEPNSSSETASDEVVETQQEESKMFTQAEMDAAIQKRLLKEERRVHRRIEQQMREQAESKIRDVEPVRETFRDEEEYLQAQIEHLAEKRAEEKLSQREKSLRAEQASDAFTERAEKAQERYPDFQTVVGNPALAINEGMAEFISDSDAGPDVAYFLGKNPNKALQISQMSPFKAARALMDIEKDISSKPQAKPSKAPEPITPVGSRGKSSSSPLPSDEDDIDTWMRKEAQRTRGR
jgi:hypothetical protein